MAGAIGPKGLRAFSRAIGTNTLAAQPIASANGFTLLAACDATGTPQLSMDTANDDTVVQYSYVNGADAPVGGRDNNLDAGDTPTDVDEGQTNGAGTVTAATPQDPAEHGEHRAPSRGW